MHRIQLSGESKRDLQNLLINNIIKINKALEGEIILKSSLDTMSVEDLEEMCLQLLQEYNNQFLPKAQSH